MNNGKCNAFLCVMGAVVTEQRVGGLGVRVPVGTREFLFSKISRLALGPRKPPIDWVLGFFPGGKAVGV